jgi:hypothetical protein
MKKPEKEIEINEPAPAPTGYGSHHLVFDHQKNKWTLRVTVDMGPKVVGKRVKVLFKAQDLVIACIKRDAILEAFKALGLKIHPRMQKPTKAQPDPPTGTTATD